MASLIGGCGNLQGPGIGKAHILAGEAENPAGDVEGIFPGLDRRVGVGVTHRLMEGGDQVVMLLPVFIV